MNSVIETINAHKSVRRYKKQAIDKALLNEIINAGMRASNTGNMQLYSIIATTDDGVKEQLAPVHFNQPMITSAPVVLTFCADVNRFTKWCEMRNADAGFYNAESLISAFVDASLAAQNVCIAAEANGLGICYLGTTTYNAKQIIDVLKLPKGVVPVTTVTVGYPDEDAPMSSRLPLTAVLHEETYHDYSEKDICSAFEAMENDPNNEKFIRENNKQNLAQVFAEVRYSKANNEFFSKEFLDALRGQGML